MNSNGRYSGTARYLSAHWPTYALAYGTAIAALLLMALGIETRWLSLLPLGLLLFLLPLAFIITSLRAAHRLYDPGGIVPHQLLFEMGQLNGRSHFGLIDIGLRHQAVDLADLLTSGHISVMDIYNPQLISSGSVARSQRQHPPHDPRLTWLESSLSLLPLPNSSVPVVIACEILSHLDQEGDRLVLLREINRVLTPNGRLLMAERSRTQTNWLALGTAAANLHPASYWRHLLTNAGFHIRREQEPDGLILCLRADKPPATTGQQLRLNLQLDDAKGKEAEGNRGRGGFFSA